MAADADVSDWLDAMAAGECTRDEFIDAILRREPEEPDVGWKALAQLDQQFRRHRIGRDDFTSLKARLYQHFVSSSANLPLPAPAPAFAPDLESELEPEPEPAPVMTTRAAPLVEIPVAAAREAANADELIEVPLHCELRAGDKLRDRYRVVELLRRNAAGTLVEAIDELKLELPVRNRVAIQVVDEELSREPDYLHRIGKLQGLSHPAIARLLDVDTDDGALLLVMDLLNGPSLHDLLSRTASKPLHASVVQAALCAVASALSHAHSQGLTHGDVRAMNVIITQAGDFRLQGFELQDVRHPTDAAADRLAFAQLAYQALSVPHPVSLQLDSSPRLRRPRSISREQWRALHDALTSNGGQRRDVLAAFARDAPAASFKRWAAAACIVAFVGIAGYFVPNVGSRNSSAPVAAAPAALIAAEPPANTTPPPIEVDTPALPLVEAASPAPPPPRIDLSPESSVAQTTAPVARIWVRRRGSLDGPVTFKWWTESGSAEADRDFRKVAPRTETIPDGARGLEILVPLMPDPLRREARTFWVKIDEAGHGATLGTKTSMQVAIVPPGYPAQGRDAG